MGLLVRMGGGPGGGAKFQYFMFLFIAFLCSFQKKLEKVAFPSPHNGQFCKIVRKLISNCLIITFEHIIEELVHLILETLNLTFKVQF